MDDAQITWLTYAVLAFDAALVMWYGKYGPQPILFPRSLCRPRVVATPSPRK
jgi:hypothetical protein